MKLRSKLGMGGRRVALLALLMALVGAGLAAYYFRPLPIAAAPALASLNADARRGEYLAKIGNCSACHTNPGGQSMAGGVRFVTDFGTIYSTNITSDPNEGIGKWSFASFHRAMKHGIGVDGERLYPAFPYTSFARMSDEDIASLYVYLRSAAPVAQPNRDNEMTSPFGYRDLLHFWQRLFHDSKRFKADATRSADWNRGAYLVQAVAHCGECHTPRNAIGGAMHGRPLAGGTYVDKVRNGAYRRWSAVDLTPGSSGLAGWNAKDIENYLLEGHNRHAVVHGPMREVWESTRQLAKGDGAAIAAYLSKLEPSSDRFGLSIPSFGKDSGEVVYTVHCGTCHLPDGKGDPTLGVSLNNNPIVQAEDPSSLINVILYGPELPPSPFSVARSRMKPFGLRLSDDDIAELTTYLRSNFGNNASSVSANQVARQR